MIMNKAVLKIEDVKEAFDEAVGIAIDGHESIAELGELFEAIRNAAHNDEGLRRLASVGMFVANENAKVIFHRTERFKIANEIE